MKMVGMVREEAFGVHCVVAALASWVRLMEILALHISSSQ
jgi:hypothetical protein